MSSTVVFTGGGTGGHIFPGLAVADELRQLYSEAGLQCRIVWIGSSKGMDGSIIEKSGSVDTFYGIPTGKLRRYFDLKNFTDPFRVIRGIGQARRLIHKIKPDVVLYEEGLDSGTIQSSVRAISEAQVLIVGGTSLAVYPAAGLIDYFQGDKVVLINKGATSRDAHADLVIKEPIGQVLGQIQVR